jgi:tetratricopeptide (TPR) repeat protein
VRALTLLAAALATACGPAPGKRGTQVGFARELLPAELAPTPTGEVIGRARVTVYADDDYRARTLNWERKFSVMLRRANKVLGPTAGIELEIAEAHSWARKAASSDMEAMLAELEDLDPGADVHFVVGLTAALPEVTSTIHQLGIARPLAKHVVIRGLNDTKEIAVLGAALSQLSNESRQRLWSIRKKHKETVVFLHELGHALGALHVSEPRGLLTPGYDTGIARFTPANARLMRIVAGFRLAGARDRGRELEAIRAYLAAARYPGWVAEDKERLGQLLDQQQSGAGSPVEIAPLSDQVRPSDRKTYRAAVELADSGRAIDAWEAAEPLFEFYPDEPGLAVLACRLADARGLPPAEVDTRCRRAAELAPADLTPTLKIALAAVASGKAAEAAAALGDARDRLLGIGGDRPEALAEAWAQLAAAYRELELVGLALDAADRSGGEAEAVAGWARARMSRYGLPPLGSKRRGARLPPTADADYINAVKAVLKLVYARKLGEAEKLAAATRRRFGETAGIETALCDLEIRRRRYPVARTHCKRALRLFEGGAWTHYLSGLLEQRDGRRARAIEHLTRAIELDSTLRHAYKVLEELYRDAGMTAELEALRARYRASFGSSL